VHNLSSLEPHKYATSIICRLSYEPPQPCRGLWIIDQHAGGSIETRHSPSVETSSIAPVWNLSEEELHRDDVEEVLCDIYMLQRSL
jgi:hypothetical protein